MDIDLDETGGIVIVIFLLIFALGLYFIYYGFWFWVIKSILATLINIFKG